ncbi:LOW QUALITY PROTEIN: hypothetical protein ACHAXS_000125, partial [Conticribra weissflogii]
MEGWLHLLGKAFQPHRSKLLSLQSKWEFPSNLVSTGVSCPKKGDVIILLYLKKTHKYSVPLSKSMDNALAIDRCSGTTIWADAISKETKNVRVVFDTLEDDRNVPHGF